MKRILIFILFFITGCNNNEVNDINIYMNKFDNYNNTLLENSDKLFDLKNTNIKENEIKESILNYKLNYNLKQKYKDEILSNININNINDEIKYGLISKRSDLKAFPTYIEFLSSNNFDLNQESELHVATPILILHESLDTNWLYIRTYFYEGWTYKNNVMIVDKKTYNNFLNPEKYIIITEPLIEINNTYLDMSVKLPLVNEYDNHYEVLIPNNNKLENINIDKEKANKGYLEYNLDNVINQAKKYLDMDYGWGGKNNKVDCSSYVGNVFRTFGFMFPRNTSEQRNIIGEITDTTNLSENEIINILNNTTYPTLIYTNNHVLLYIGNENKKQYVIHASGNSLTVQIDSLDNVIGKNLYNEIISINEIKELY